MHCPYCRNTDTRVLDSRVADDGGAIRRRRTCSECGKRFSTVEQMQLVVVKRSGATEPFTREKAVAGVRKACKGRPVSEDDLACLGQKVEDTLRSEGWAEVPAHEVGLAILAPLRELDEVAYLRFASVYRAFECADDFEAEIAMLRAERPAGRSSRARRRTTSAHGLTTDCPARRGEAARPGNQRSRHPDGIDSTTRQHTRSAARNTGRTRSRA